MKKIVVAPDSFKHTIPSVRFCEIASDVIRAHRPGCEVRAVPIADGGEGTVDCFLAAAGGRKVSLTVKGPFFEDVAACYGLTPGGAAVIETAAAAGLPLAEGREDPITATTYGVGQLMRHALESGVRDVILGLGGSATNDGGCGAAAALGAVFLDGAGQAFVPAGGTLKDISRIDLSGLCPETKDARITVMCDVDNPLYGPNGAAMVFSPQKGAGAKDAVLLDAGLQHLSDVIRRDFGPDVSHVPGGGAAGGMGAGLPAFLGAQRKPGADVLFDLLDFDGILRGAGLVITGEGRFDAQSLMGKAAISVARRAKRAGVPAVVVAGDIGDGIEGAYDMGVSAVFSTNRAAIPFAAARTRAEKDLRATLDGLIRLITALF